MKKIILGLVGILIAPLANADLACSALKISGFNFSKECTKDPCFVDFSEPAQKEIVYSNDVQFNRDNLDVSSDCQGKKGSDYRKLPEKCEFHIFFAKRQRSDRGIECKCSKLGCGDYLAPASANLEVIKRELSESGCGDTVIGDREKNQPFYISSEKCLFRNNCPDETSPHFLTKESKFATYCVPVQIGKNKKNPSAK